MAKDISEKLKNEIEKLYSHKKSMRYVSRELKVGIKRIRTVLIKRGYTISSYERPFCKTINIGNIVGRWTVIGLPIKDKNNRYVIPVQCECGTQTTVRPSVILNHTGNGCKHCVNKNNYPTFRKSRCHPNIELEGLSSSWLSSIKNYSHRGLNRNIDIDINSYDLLQQLKKQNFKCVYTGIQLNVLNISKLQSNASVDRIDSSKDYTSDNIQWVYKKINRMKNDLSQKEFLDLCSQIHNYKHVNFEPSSSNTIKIVDEKVQRLVDEDSNQ
jgi:hypothetical protein